MQFNELLSDKDQLLGILNLYPEGVSLHDADHKIICANDLFTKSVGFNNLEQIEGITKNDFNCKLSDDADLYMSQDRLVLNTKRTIKSLSYYCLANDIWTLSYAIKSPIKDASGNIIGFSQYFNSIEDLHIQDLCMQLTKVDSKYIAKSSTPSICYTIDPITKNFSLTKRESEVLFFILRGKSAKEVGSKLFLSKRTIESHINSLKIKFNCNSKSELIGKAIDSGLINYIPSSIL